MAPKCKRSHTALSNYNLVEYAFTTQAQRCQFESDRGHVTTNRRASIVQLLLLAEENRITDSNQMGNLVAFELNDGMCIMLTFQDEESADNFLSSINFIQMAMLQDEFGFEVETLDP